MPAIAAMLACSLILTSSPTPNSGRRPELPGRDTDRMSVLFIDSFYPGDPWSDAFIRLMREAADELDIALTVHRAARWPPTALGELQELLQREERPDYLVMMVAPGYRARLIQLAEQAGVPFFLVNAGLLPEDRRRYGGPREHFKHWLGQMLPDDEQAGYVLAQRLIAEAIRLGKVGPDGRVQMVALSGTQVDYPSTQREKGLARAVRERSDVTLHQVVWVEWDIDEARRKAPLLFRRHAATTVVWAAGDTIARGAVEGLAAEGLEAGVDFLIGGVDWEPWALNAVKQGRMVTSVGGHVLEGAWSLVLLYDHEQGVALPAPCLDLRTPMTAATASTALRYELLMEPGPQWRGAQFSVLSRAKHPERSVCDVSVDEQLRHLASPTDRRSRSRQ